MEETVQAASLIQTIIPKLLDWPFLFFLLAAILFWRGRDAVLEIVAGRQLEFEIGGQKVRLGDAITRLDGDGDVTKAEVDDLKRQVDAMRSRLEEIGGQPAVEAPSPPPAPPAGADARSDEDIYQRMTDSLMHHSYTWRSIERLALEAGVSEERAHSILSSLGESYVKIGKAKSGKKIARLIGK